MFPRAVSAGSTGFNPAARRPAGNFTRVCRWKIDTWSAPDAGEGHDFPNVTLVGVIDPTPRLIPDFRSAERTFQP
jgi:hypothetical protein